MMMMLVRPALAIAALVAVALPATGAASTRSERTKLDTARARWAHASLRDYRYSIERGCFCPQTGPKTVVVHGGRLTRSDKGYRDVDTVGELHQLVARVLRGTGTVTARYDRRGVPTSVSVDPIPMAVDDEYHLAITRFRVLKPRR